MPKLIETGARFGRLVVLNGGSFNSAHRVACRCDCGLPAVPAAAKLVSGHTQSCGCKQRDAIRAIASKHGNAKRPEFHVWRGMVARCTSEKSAYWHVYGGRGIKVCDRWLSFDNFFSDMGPRPAGMTLERADTNGDYTPGNCSWKTPRAQAQNTRRSRVWVIDGYEFPSLRAAGKALGVGATTIAQWCAGGRPGCSSRLLYTGAGRC